MSWELSSINQVPTIQSARARWNWDEGVHLVLFAAREAVQESLGFSPFELVFGHTIRGPLKLLMEKCLTETSDLNLLDYVSDFKE